MARRSVAGDARARPARVARETATECPRGRGTALLPGAARCCPGGGSGRDRPSPVPERGSGVAGDAGQLAQAAIDERDRPSEAGVDLVLGVHVSGWLDQAEPVEEAA